MQRPTKCLVALTTQVNLIIFNSSENNDVEVELHCRARLYPILHGLFTSLPLLGISLFFAFGSRRGSHEE